jgi:hypothetical protein
MQFPVISIDILKLHIEKSPKECLLQWLQFYVFWMKWIWDSPLREGCHRNYRPSWRRKESRFVKKC